MLNLLDIFIRSLVSVVFLFLITELMGKKQISQLNMFDYIIGISIGSIAASLSVDDSINYIDGIFSMLVYGGIATIISILTTKSIKLRRIFTGTPSILIGNGKIDYHNLKKSRLDINDLLQIARENGYYDISEINYAILEPSGKVSFLPKAKYVPTTPNDMKIKVSDNSICSNLVIDGVIMENNLKNIDKNRDWLITRLNKLGFDDVSKLVLVICDNKEKLTVFEKTSNLNNKRVLE